MKASSRPSPSRTPAGATNQQAGIGRKQWSSPWVFVFAASGAAIGFNNIWQFPYLAAEHGGGAFLLVYLFCVLLIGVPLLAAEAALGRAGRASPIGSLRALADRAHADPNWAMVGALAVLASFLTFSYLSVVGAWTLAYWLRAVVGTLSGLTADGLSSLFTAFVKDPEKQLFWHVLFLGATLLVSARGVHRGLEPVIRHAVPLLFVLLFVLLGYALSLGDPLASLAPVFALDFTRLTGYSVLHAAAHAFFSLGLGAGVMLMYGAYLEAQAPVGRLAAAVAAADTLAGLAAAAVVFAVLAAGSVETAAGPALIFQAMPLAFDHVPLGRLFVVLFYALLVIAAWLSALALAEPAVAWLTERFATSRPRAALAVGLGAWVLGLAVILSFNYWAFTFKFFGMLKSLGFFDVLQIATAELMLPLTGILVALFAGWTMRSDDTRQWLVLRSPCVYDAWLWLARLGIPVTLLLVLIHLPRLLA